SPGGAGGSCQSFGLMHCQFHAGGVPGLTELRFVHTILLEQPDHGIDIGQSLTLIMDRLEDGCMGFFQFAHAFQRIEQLTVGVPAATEERRNRAEVGMRSEEHTSELQSREKLVCRLLLEKKT